jgi:hypothetical protein
VDADLDTRATARYVRTDDLLKSCPARAPWRPPAGITPGLSDAELLTLAVMQALPGPPARLAGCGMPASRCGDCSPICASHSRYFWGLRLHLLCTLHGLPVGFALAGAKADDRVGQRHRRRPARLERHGGHTPAGVITRVLQRILALTVAIWHNDHTGQPVMRSLIAYDYY